jgi:uncharacterized membrane protein
MNSEAATYPGMSAPPSAVVPAKFVAASLPWFCSAVVFGAVCIPLGVLWDISWHSTIGRDTFWTPAHMLIYLGGAMPGMVCGWLVLKTTFAGTVEERERAVRIWGFRGPLGAWIIIWGSLAMLTSAPFDNWWHDAYGLDVRILSPPHTVLALGMYGVAVGAWVLIASWRNRVSGLAERHSVWLFVLLGGVLITMLNIFMTEFSLPNDQHNGTFYRVSCRAYPIYLAIIARAAQMRWAATKAALVFMGIVATMAWILPLFPATPKLAPIYNPVTHMVPPAFPLLLVFPALAVDAVMLLEKRLRPRWWRDWTLAVAIGLAFSAVFFAVQWNFSKVLVSAAADNWLLIGERHFGYGAGVGEWRHRFWGLDNDALRWGSVGIALLASFLSARLGLWLGKGLKAVQR